MNKILLIITLIFATSNLAFAQTTSNSHWKTYTLVNKEFSLEMPIGKTMSGFGEKSVRYGVVANDAYFFVFSDSPKTLLQTKLVQEIIKTHKAVGSSSAVSNAVGEKFAFADTDGFYQTILIVQTKAGSYVFQTLSETENNSSVEHFFANIQFNETSGEESSSLDNADENVPAPNSPESNPKKSSANGSGRGNDAGEGNGSGIESGGLKKAIPPVATNQTASLKILSMPGTKYTNLARYYEISGTIQLRVTFLENGEIGTVEAVKKLPFGLTVEAVNSARRIRFEPELKDGKAYTVTKLLQYGFSIY
ncbi:MAG: energy transducer TonB [Acidobacteriota bacterium]|nr:energy transducer TonB [Acidobacteriota bacterium]